MPVSQWAHAQRPHQREANILGLHGVPQDSDGAPRSIQDVRTDNDASPVVRPEEFNLGAENPGSQSSEAQRGRRLNADRTQASTVRDAAADEGFPTVVDGSDTDSVVGELERDCAVECRRGFLVGGWISC